GGKAGETVVSNTMEQGDRSTGPEKGLIGIIGRAAGIAVEKDIDGAECRIGTQAVSQSKSHGCQVTACSGGELSRNLSIVGAASDLVGQSGIVSVTWTESIKYRYIGVRSSSHKSTCDNYEKLFHFWGFL